MLMLDTPHFAVCNEMFGQTPFEQVCKEVGRLGYGGLEVAPFTLAEDPASLSEERRGELCRMMKDEGLCFVGFHWLLATPPGLHMTTRDESVRARTWEYMHKLIDLCADLAVCKAEYNAVMVIGSPKQRSAVDGMTPKDAVNIFTHELAHTAPYAESRGVKLLIEPLSPDQTNVITSLQDAVTIVKQIGSPAVQTMFDTHNAVAEQDAHAELIRRYCSYIQHVHVNEMDGREPGTGDYHFGSLLNALAAAKYPGWISLEVFDFKRGGRQIAEDSLNYLKKVAPEAALSHTV
jgi:D-psicose/D-tagatose/L-ribulose 3-epimerase